MPRPPTPPPIGDRPLRAPTPPPLSERPLRIAVIGSGIAGLSASHLLSSKHEVTIFEREAKLGMDAHAVQNKDGTHFDVPLRIFNPMYYPNLTALYDKVKVAYEPVSSAFSCTYLLPDPVGRSRLRSGSTSLA